MEAQSGMVREIDRMDLGGTCQRHSKPPEPARGLSKGPRALLSAGTESRATGSVLVHEADKVATFRIGGMLELSQLP
jgi:hypothetical protein